MNLLVRGMEGGDTPLADVQALFTRMGINLACALAWKVGKVELPARPLVMKFWTAVDMCTLISRREVPKGTNIYLDDDLTLMQQENKKGMI